MKRRLAKHFIKHCAIDDGWPCARWYLKRENCKISVWESGIVDNPWTANGHVSTGYSIRNSNTANAKIDGDFESLSIMSCKDESRATGFHWKCSFLALKYFVACLFKPWWQSQWFSASYIGRCQITNSLRVARPLMSMCDALQNSEMESLHAYRSGLLKRTRKVLMIHQ